MAQRMNNSYLQIQEEHKTRVKNVMVDIKALKESITVPADHTANSWEMQQLKFEVAQYESVIPIYLARIKDTEDSNQKLLEENTKNILALTSHLEHISTSNNHKEPGQ